MSSEAVFKVRSWDEKPALELANGAKVTRASVEQDYTGGINGKGSVEYVMFHRQDGTASFVGVEHLEASVDGRAGTLALRHRGSYEGGAARSAWEVVEGSGTGGLAGAAGRGAFEAGHDMTGRVTYDIGVPGASE